MQKTKIKIILAGLILFSPSAHAGGGDQEICLLPSCALDVLNMFSQLYRGCDDREDQCKLDLQQSQQDLIDCNATIESEAKTYNQYLFKLDQEIDKLTNEINRKDRKIRRLQIKLNGK